MASNERLVIQSFTRTQLSTAHQAQSDAHHGVKNRSSKNTILAAYSASILSLVFKSGPTALATLTFDVARGAGRSAYLSVLYNGKRSLGHILQQMNIAPSILKIEVKVGVLETTVSGGKTVRFYQGNGSNPSSGYTLLRVRTSSGWMDM